MRNERVKRLCFCRVAPCVFALAGESEANEGCHWFESSWGSPKKHLRKRVHHIGVSWCFIKYAVPYEDGLTTLRFCDKIVLEDGRTMN